jgi:hypothetical protein
VVEAAELVDERRQRSRLQSIVIEQKPLSGVIQEPKAGDWIMKLKSLLTAFAFLLGAATISLAQSQPNCGPDGPGNGDTFGKFPTGTLGGRIGAEQCRAYLYRQNSHNHYGHHHHYDRYGRHWHRHYSDR